MIEQERYEATAALSDVQSLCRSSRMGGTTTAITLGRMGFQWTCRLRAGPLSFTILAIRHAAGVSPQIVLEELQRVGAVTEVGSNVWKPLKQEYIEPSLSPENLGRMASLVESLLSTLENNTRPSKKDGTDLFERTVTVEAPLTQNQLIELHNYMKVFGAQFLHRVDAFAAIDLQEKLGGRPGELANIQAGLECFLFVEPKDDATSLRDAIDLSPTKQ